MKRLIIFDMDDAGEKLIPVKKDDFLFSARPAVHSCTGCFGCWIRTPGACVIGDRCEMIPREISECSELWLISRSLYGGHSQNVKAVLDRSFGYMLPYFRIASGEMHHRKRYDHDFKLVSCYYGEVPEAEKEIADRLTKANALNMGISSYDTLFLKDEQAVVEALL